MKTIKVTSNKSKRTYTIRVNGSKYRTYPMSKEEFNSCYYNTETDWNQFLRSPGYYKI